jgi:hypothetical protein
LQGVPSLSADTTQPSCGSQTPSEQTSSRNEQSTSCPGTQAPPEQLAEMVHGSSSMQLAPSLPGTSTHESVTTSHEPTMQGLSDEHGASGPVHSPAWQVSVTVQVLPSSQAAPSFTSASRRRIDAVPSLRLSVLVAQSAALTRTEPPALAVELEVELRCYRRRRPPHRPPG